MSTYLFEKPLIRGTLLKRKSQFTALVDRGCQEFCVFRLTKGKRKKAGHKIVQAAFLFSSCGYMLWPDQSLL